MSAMVVTRFAPSPTGYLHVGGARTALFNWLWARHSGGKFILRIEDTDVKRNTPTAIQQVINDLRWLGLDWDEGPEVGGPSGPYLQSQRRDIYDKYIRQLIDEQKAYYCFDTLEQLDALRKEAEAKKENFIYPRPKDFSDSSQAEKARAEGKPVTVRFAVPRSETIVVNDVVRGEVSFAGEQISDLVIQKSDGFPTYNFACVVDDYLMKVTHVIRGQEHLMNTPCQQALWEALFPDAPLPKYAHMSVTVSDAGGKLSKHERPKKLREIIQPQATAGFVNTIAANSAVGAWPALTVAQVWDFIDGKSIPDMPYIEKIEGFVGVQPPEINVVDFFKSGYLPETMVNFLALLGWNPGGDREIMPVDELIESFDLARLTKSNSLFDRQKLLAFNTEHLRMVPKERLIDHLRNYLRAIDSPIKNAPAQELHWMIERSQGARTLADFDLKWRGRFITAEQVKDNCTKDEAWKVLSNDGKILPEVRSQLETISGVITVAQAETILRDLAKQHQVGLRKVAQPVRVALCGSVVSASIFDLMELLGKEEILTRIDNAIQLIQGKAMI